MGKVGTVVAATMAVTVWGLVAGAVCYLLRSLTGWYSKSKPAMGVGEGSVNRVRSVEMNATFLDSLKDSGAFTGKQLAAIATAAAVAKGEKWTEGAVYERVAPPGVKTSGDLYVATSKLASKDGDDREFNMLNVTHRSGKPTREVYEAGKFTKIADSLASLIN